MSVSASSSVEQIEAYLGSLDVEQRGYHDRIAAAKAGRLERLSVEQLKDRIGQVDAEVKRAKALLGKADKAGKAEAAEAVKEEAAA